MPAFGTTSAGRLAAAHPLLQKLFNEVIKHVDIIILESQRGKADQETAFAKGNSKAHFGQSAHNWTPSVALDVAPNPLDWNNRASFIAVSKVVLPLAKQMGIPIRWGGDWNMNGILTDERLSDLPHYELNPWRDFAKRDCKLFGT
jgi:peptidoglycan L-alanyl-D-glutamate endopeptidase CwlK